MCNTDFHESQLENIMEKLVEDSNFKALMIWLKICYIIMAFTVLG